MSGQFAQLKPAQIRELKEAFTLLDKDGDGTLNESDLEEMLVSLGQEPDSQYISDMLQQMPSPLTFSAFLTGMTGHLNSLSSRQELAQAFGGFGDDSGEDLADIDAEELERSLIEYGMDQADVKRALASYTFEDGFRGRRFRSKDFVDLLRPE